MLYTHWVPVLWSGGCVCSILTGCLCCGAMGVYALYSLGACVVERWVCMLYTHWMPVVEQWVHMLYTYWVPVLWCDRCVCSILTGCLHGGVVGVYAYTHWVPVWWSSGCVCLYSLGACVVERWVCTRELMSTSYTRCTASWISCWVCDLAILIRSCNHHHQDIKHHLVPKGTIYHDGTIPRVYCITFV